MTDARLMEWILDEHIEAPPGGSALAERVPPDALVQRTLSLVEAEWDTNPRRSWRTGAVTLALAAGVFLAVQLPQPPPAVSPVEQMTPKGLEAIAPEISLKMAVESRGRLLRVEDGGLYSAGDQIYFRVSSTDASWVYLVQEIEGQLSFLATQQVGPGETDLGTHSALLSWTIDAGDPASVFAVIGSFEPIQTETLTEALGSSEKKGELDSRQRICVMARSMGWSCDVREIKVTP
jgi:hypothetical protein